MVHLYRSMAWLLIFTMLFHSVSEVNFIFAEDTPTASSSADGEQKRRRKRVRSQANNSVEKVASQSTNNVSNQSSAEASKAVAKVDEEGRNENGPRPPITGTMDRTRKSGRPSSISCRQKKLSLHACKIP